MTCSSGPQSDRRQPWYLRHCLITEQPRVGLLIKEPDAFRSAAGILHFRKMVGPRPGSSTALTTQIRMEFCHLHAKFMPALMIGTQRQMSVQAIERAGYVYHPRRWAQRDAALPTEKDGSA